MRLDNRIPNEMRDIEFIPNYTVHAEGSVLVSYGATKVICTASVEPNLPKWMQGNGRGWVTAEYSMLPRATHTRSKRDKANNSGRSVEISRLIGRSLRAAVDLQKLGERQILVDCDVIQADGGTRTASITGAFVAIALACKHLLDDGVLKEIPLNAYVGAVSVGLGPEGALLDLNYEEDSSIDTDMNFVVNSKQQFIEIQGTAEGQAFSKQEMDQMIDFAYQGCDEIFDAQEKIIGDFYPRQ
ncbi:MAG: ribonuclease PH [Bdellovibrionales bacterium]